MLRNVSIFYTYYISGFYAEPTNFWKSRSLRTSFDGWTKVKSQVQVCVVVKSFRREFPKLLIFAGRRELGVQHVGQWL